MENTQDYLQTSAIIDWQHPTILELARTIALEHQTSNAIAFGAAEAFGHAARTPIAKACFEWVRDHICHSVDYKMNPVTCRASDVLKHKTGYCYAKSHLLAALLRANGIPAGFCYQRLSIHDDGEPYSLHGLNAVYLAEFGWYRIDPRGNREGIDAQFNPPKEQLAFSIRLPGEADFPNIFSEPLPIVIEALQAGSTWDEMLGSLPDVLLEEWEELRMKN
ncbi:MULTISPECIES: transglutaminase family protein [unclassified Moorena]|nr:MULTISPECIES: transglutaminase family protein [unclassified Moorena]NEO21533.1 transglutaminase family protein [Moorena sp. SIO4A5]NEQ58822.1 transglutaminase family protein [Moorena sp. SIO4A1]